MMCLALTMAWSGSAMAGDMVGAVRHHRVAPGENLLDLARGYDVGYVEMVAANPELHPWVPTPGSTVLIPGAHILPQAHWQGIVVNLGDMRLYYFERPGAAPMTFPIGVGREGYELRTGVAHVVNKRVNPTWTVPPSVRRDKPYLPPTVPPGPANPLGAYSLDLDWPAIRIHGTNLPDGVGRRVSRGCIRLYPEDIERLFARVPLGTPVTVVNQPAKVGWANGQLFLEVHPSPDQADQLEDERRFTPERVPGLETMVRKAAGIAADRIDWQMVTAVADRRQGVPVPILKADGQSARLPPARSPASAYGPWSGTGAR